MLRVYPQSALAYNNIGLTYVQNGKFEEAIPYYLRALSIRPSYFYARNDLANSYKKTGKLDLAEEQYKKTIETRPSYLIAYSALAKLYEESNKKDLTLATLIAASKVRREDTPLAESEFKNVTSRVYYDIAVFYESQKKVSQAYEAYKKSLLLAPQVKTVQRGLNDLVIKNPSLWPRAQFGNLTFSYPADWQKKEESDKVVLSSSDRHFSIELVVDDWALPASQYLARQTDSYGRLISQEFTKIANIDAAYVKVWSVKDGDRDVHKIQFFLFKGQKVIKILAYPSESTLQSIFDGMIETIKIQ